jgi:RHS repeat-associated protein
MKLVRTGSTITTHASSNGTSWTQVGSSTLTLGSTAQIGLFITSHDVATLGTAVFDNVTITGNTGGGGGGTPTWQNTNIGSPALTGTTNVASGTYTLTGAGSDIWASDDQFNYYNQTLSGDGSIVARLTSQSNTNAWAKSGIMIKESTTPGSTYAGIMNTPGSGLRMQSTWAQDVSGGSTTMPNTWLKLTRVGNVFTGYSSTNGTAWTQISQVTLTMATTATIGLFITSHDVATLGTAVFDNVTVTGNTGGGGGGGTPTTTDYKYGFTGSSDTPDLLLNAAGNAVVEKYLQLPGGVLLTVRPTQSGNAQKVFSLVNVHGDVLATTDASGSQTGTFTYDPFGNPVSTSPNNTATGSTYGWVGQHEKDTETAFTLAPTEMGARVYLAKIGRFLQVDPQEGGAENNYVYPPDTINDFDLDGNASSFWKSAIHAVTRVATVASYIPGPIGIVASGVAVAGNLAQGHYAEAGIAAFGLIGGGAIGKLALKGVTSTKVLTKLMSIQAKAPIIGTNSKLFGLSKGWLNKKLPQITGGFRAGWGKGTNGSGQLVFRAGTRGPHNHFYSFPTNLNWGRYIKR